VFDGEALVWPGVEDSRLGESEVGEPPDPSPCHAVFLAASLERTPPEVDDIEAEGHECLNIGRNCVVLEEACDHLLEPFPLFADWPVHSPGLQ
jgi:hypothetical protein